MPIPSDGEETEESQRRPNRRDNLKNKPCSAREKLQELAESNDDGGSHGDDRIRNGENDMVVPELHLPERGKSMENSSSSTTEGSDSNEDGDQARERSMSGDATGGSEQLTRESENEAAGENEDNDKKRSLRVKIRIEAIGVRISPKSYRRNLLGDFTAIKTKRAECISVGDEYEVTPGEALERIKGSIIWSPHADGQYPKRHPDDADSLKELCRNYKGKSNDAIKLLSNVTDREFEWRKGISPEDRYKTMANEMVKGRIKALGYTEKERIRKGTMKAKKDRKEHRIEGKELLEMCMIMGQRMLDNRESMNDEDREHLQNVFVTELKGQVPKKNTNEKYENVRILPSHYVIYTPGQEAHGYIGPFMETATDSYERRSYVERNKITKTAQKEDLSPEDVEMETADANDLSFATLKVRYEWARVINKINDATLTAFDSGTRREHTAPRRRNAKYVMRDPKMNATGTKPTDGST